MKTARASIRSQRQALEAGAAREWRERAGRLYGEFERQATAMVRRAFRGAFSTQELEDIYSGAWLGTLRALEGRHQGMSDDEVRKYLLTAVANQAAKELRRRKRKPTAPLELVESVGDTADTPDEQAARRERSRVTRDLLLSLPPRRRAVMLLRYGWGLEPKQVCALLDGLSPRAYRKEITRGVEELTERMRRFERGSWCGDREPLLRSMVAGLASEDEERQARAHLAHCRDCTEFVASLRANLHELGSALLVPASAGAFEEPLALGGSTLVDRAREAVGTLAGRADAQAAQELAMRTVSSGGEKGSGAAGVGVLAKLAGLGMAGKATVACLAGGAAATACIAAGLGPTAETARTSAADRPDPTRRAGTVPQPADVEETLPSQVGNEYTPPPPESAAPTGEETPTQPPPPAEEEPAPVEEVVAPTTPPVEQEFGVAAAAAPAPAPADGGTTGAGGGAASGGPSPVQQEFGP